MNFNPMRSILSGYGVTFLILISVMLFASCSIERRHYRDGVYIDWYNSHGETKSNIQPSVAEKNVVLLSLKDSVPSQSKSTNNNAKDESKNVIATETFLEWRTIVDSSRPEVIASDKYTEDSIAAPPDPRYDEGDDLKLALYALGAALVGFLLITLLFDFLPVILPTLIAVAAFLVAMYFLILSIRWHVKRNGKRKEAGEATTHRELGRRILHALMVVATIFIGAYSLLLAVFLTDW